MRQEAHSGSSCSPWWRHSLVWEGTRPTHFPWNINAIMIIILSEHFGNGACGITSHHVSSSAPSEGYERCPLFRPCPRSKARWGLRWALVAARSNPREYQLLSQQKCRQGTEAASHCWNFLNATAWYCSLWKNYRRYCMLCFSNRLCFSDLFCITIDWIALQHVFLFIPTVGSLWDM